MSESRIENQLIVQYLLGALSESETERLDELSITDERFAESLRMAEHELIDAYVQGELGSDDLQRFNASYLAQAPQRDRVAFAQALQEWTAKDTASESVRVSEPAPHGAWFSWLFDPQRVALRWAALAAAVILLFTAGMFIVQNLRSRSRLRAEQARREQILQGEPQSPRPANSNTENGLARLPDEQKQRGAEPPNAKATPSPAARVVAFSLAAPTRGAGQIRTVSLPPDAGLVKIGLELEADFPVYRVQLLDSAGRQTLWRSPNLKPQT